MGFERINIYTATKRPYYVVNQIKANISRVFTSHLESAGKFGVKIYFNGIIISNISNLVFQVAKRYLENDKRTLGLFLKAIQCTNQKAMDALKKPIHLELNLGRLLPAYLIRQDLQGKAEDFRNTEDLRTAFNILQEMGVVKIHHNPPTLYKTEHLSSTDDNIDELRRKRIGDLIKEVNARLDDVTIKFDEAPIQKPADLPPGIMKDEFDEKSRRTIDLFVRAIDSLLLYADEKVTSSYIFTLDLAFLLPGKMKRYGVNVKEKEIDAIIKSPNEDEVISFLDDVGALKKNHLPIKKQSGLSYPERF